MNVVDQLTKRGITPKSRVNMVVILGIVFMIRGRGEDRIQVKDVSSQRIFYVAKFLVDALQVAAEKYGAIRITSVSVRTRSPGFIFDVDAILCVLVCLYFVAGVSIIEAIGENLVHDSVLSPGWRGKVRQDVEVA
jgi:hypothetical protein